jgi:hypothetical protein
LQSLPQPTIPSPSLAGWLTVTADVATQAAEPVFACAAWRNAICLADGAAQLDDVHADMQRLAQICAADAPRSAREAFRQSDANEWRAGEKAVIA